MREIKHDNRDFSQYHAEFQVLAADRDWNPSALRNALRMGLSKEMKDSFTYSDMPEELPALGTVCQKRDNQIRQRRAEKAAQNKGSGIGFASPRPAPAPKAPDAAPAGTVAGYTGPAQMILAQEKGGFRGTKEQRDLRMGGVYTVVGLTTGPWNARKGKRLRH